MTLSVFSCCLGFVFILQYEDGDGCTLMGTSAGLLFVCFAEMITSMGCFLCVFDDALGFVTVGIFSQSCKRLGVSFLIMTLPSC